ncbi:hypothetical protein KAK05_02060 [Candidatus Parcubacteria bacterium]|nr:hypothetical protein [Candidatus Parcubacteria bacterium]
MEIIMLLEKLRFFIPFVWLIAILAYSIKKNNLNLKWIKYGILTTLIIFLILGTYSAILTYEKWSQDQLGQFLLPPYNSAYFYRYVFFHYFLTEIIGIIASLSWVIFLIFLRKYYKKHLVSKKEVWLGFFTSLFVGWPLFIIYLIFTFGFLLISQIINNFLFKNKKSVTITYYMILSSLTTIIIGKAMIYIMKLEVLII